MNCRHCRANLDLPLIDLGSAPPSNAYLTEQTLRAPEKWYPLRVMVCTECWLVQTEDFAHAADLFNDDYAYFSSCSSSWLAHAKSYVDDMVARFKLNASCLVVEIAANDGYLLQYVLNKGIPCLGIEPTASVAAKAKNKGLEIIQDFFGLRLAGTLVDVKKQADLIVANNVLAHVPDINDFVAGVAAILKSAGIATFEFPHLVRLIEGNQFDTLYHEHFSYLSLTAVQRIFERNGLSVFDIECLPTHGGSLRVFAQRQGVNNYETTCRVSALLQQEAVAGVGNASFYSGFQAKAEKAKDDLLTFLIEAKRAGKKVAAYGAAAKGNTLLNYAGIKSDLLPVVYDAAPSKQGKFMPGSRIPIMAPEALIASPPDSLLILPWNIANEIVGYLKEVCPALNRFIIAIPRTMVI